MAERIVLRVTVAGVRRRWLMPARALLDLQWESGATEHIAVSSGEVIARLIDRRHGPFAVSVGEVGRAWVVFDFPGAGEFPSTPVHAGGSFYLSDGGGFDVLSAAREVAEQAEREEVLS